MRSLWIAIACTAIALTAISAFFSFSACASPGQGLEPANAAPAGVAEEEEAAPPAKEPRSAGGIRPAREMRVFDVRFLSAEPARGARVFPGGPLIRGHRAGGMYGVDDSPRMALEADAGARQVDSSGASLRMSPEAVESAIRKLIAEDSWSNPKNEMRTEGGRLVVTQAPDVLDKIEIFLRGLEERAARQVSLDAALVPPEALDAAAPGWKSLGASPWLPAEALDRAVAASKGKGSVFSGLLREGASQRVQPRRLSRHFVDVEVNQTGVIPVRNPVVEQVAEGSFAEVLVLRGPSGVWFRVDILAGKAACPEKGASGKVKMGDIELLVERQERIQTSLILPAGKTAVAGFFAVSTSEKDGDRGSALESFALLLRVKPAGAAGADVAPSAKEGPFVLDAGLLLEPLPRGWIELEQQWAPPPIQEDPDKKRPALMAPSLLEEAVRDAIPGAARPRAVVWSQGGAVFVDGPGIDPSEVAKKLDVVARKSARLVVVDLWQGTLGAGDLGALGTSGSVLDKSWLERMEKAEGARARISSLSGVPVSLAAVLARNYIADLQRVSGGMGHLTVEASDPEILRCGEGLIANVEASLVPDVPWAQLRLQGDAARPPIFKRQGRVRESSTVDVVREPAGGKGEVKGAAGEGSHPTGDWVLLDLPDEDSDSWNHMVTAPLGRPVLLSAFPAASRPGESRVLIAVVRAAEMEEGP